MINTVIFDMDGTILNTIDDIASSVNFALIQKGYPTKTVDEVKNAVGNGAKHLIKQVTPKHLNSTELEEVFDVYQAHYDIYNNVLTGPYPNIILVLKKLKAMGYKIAVVSNKYEHLVKALNKEVFESLFDVAIGETNGIPLKPAPDMVYKALNELQRAVDQAIYIGDSETDMLTAQNAHMKVIAVTWGFRTKEKLSPFQPTYFVDEPLEIIKILERI